MVFSKARLYRKVRGLGWPNLHSSVYYPDCTVSYIRIYCILSQEHLKARLCHYPHPCHQLIPPLLSNSILHSDTAEFGHGIKSQSNWYYWCLSFLQANNAACVCFVSGIEQQRRGLKTLNNFPAQKNTKTIWPSTGSGRSTVGHHCIVSATSAMVKYSWTCKQPAKYLSGSWQKRQQEWTLMASFFLMKCYTHLARNSVKSWNSFWQQNRAAPIPSTSCPGWLFVSCLSIALQQQGRFSWAY